MKQNLRNISFYIIAGVAILILYIIATEFKDNYEVTILEDYTISLGIIDYVTPGTEATSMSLKYHYNINGNIYSRIIEVDRPLRDFYSKYIVEDSLADEIRLSVIYSNSDNSMSLVNLKDPLIKSFQIDTVRDITAFK